MYRIGGRLEAVTPVAVELLLGYHPCSTGFLTSGLNQVGGQCQVGSLTGAVASERVSEALKGRSEERRVGKECASMCRSRWSPYH